jgi:hypothetical protein
MQHPATGNVFVDEYPHSQGETAPVC